jgi:hypothetical protein
MNKIKELELAQRWFESIPPNVSRAYIANDDLYIIIDENDEYHIQVSYAEVCHRAEQFAELINN